MRSGNANAKGEFYLTDIVEIANARGLSAVASETSVESALGINSRAELAEAEQVWQQRRRRQLMLSGVTMLAPETVHLSHDTEIGPDALVEPNVVFGPGVAVEGGARIRSFSHLEGARVAAGAEIGPLCAAEARRRCRGEGQGRQFLRDQERGARRGRQGEPSDLYRRRAYRREGQYRGGHDHLQL